MALGQGESSVLDPKLALGEPLAADKTLLPSGSAAEYVGVPPPRFGVARSEAVGHAVHGIIYEHEYDPQPVRKFSQEKPPDAECVGVLRPAVRHGRAPFRFFGVRVPASADHARCWLGRVLVAEMRLGRLQHVELSVPPEAEAPPIEQPQPLKAHGQQPSWKWSVWVAGGGPAFDARDPPVEVLMHSCPVNGIYIDLQSEHEAYRCFVFRMLRQYCDDKCKDWHPIPEEQKGIGKVLDRHICKEDQLTRLIGQHVPQEGTNDLLRRHLDDLKKAETWLVQALGRVEATKEVATLKDMVVYMRELTKALGYAHDVRFKLKGHYNNSACEALEMLLKVALKRGEDREQLGEIRDIAVEMHGYGIREPKNLAEVLSMLEA